MIASPVSITQASTCCDPINLVERDATSRGAAPHSAATRPPITPVTENDPSRPARLPRRPRRPGATPSPAVSSPTSVSRLGIARRAGPPPAARNPLRPPPPARAWRRAPAAAVEPTRAPHPRRGQPRHVRGDPIGQVDHRGRHGGQPAPSPAAERTGAMYPPAAWPPSSAGHDEPIAGPAAGTQHGARGTAYRRTAIETSTASARQVAAGQRHPVRREPGGKLVDAPRTRPARRRRRSGRAASAHGGQVGQVDGARARPDLAGVGAAAAKWTPSTSMSATDQPALQHRRVVADADHDP